VDKAGAPNSAAAKTGLRTLAGSAMIPAAAFALMASDVMHTSRLTREDMARVAVKNHGNAAKNPFAHFQKERTLEEVLAEPEIAGVLTRLQCCPIGEGAAAAVVASEDAVRRLRIPPARAVRILSSTSTSERVYDPGAWATVELTRDTVTRAYDEAGVGPEDLDVAEVHDAFTIEEILYTEALGLCARGEGARLVSEGKTCIGGECAVSPSGGLLAMGHPLGPTGVGQICEITRQLRGEAGPRQQPDAKIGLAHMVGVGQVCVVHVLRAER
jgi:acetyl-CoA acetyltransferase